MARVLIVDDSSLGRKFLTRILLKAGHEVVGEAGNGEDGILAYKRIKPEIVTMDVDMPGINGMEASKRILKDHPDARIIIISAHEQNDLQVEMEKYGLKYCIIKPVNEEKVNTAFQNALKSINDKNNKETRGNDKADKASDAGVPEKKALDFNVSISHHSIMHILLAEKTGEDGSMLLLEIEKGTPLNGFAEDDPIVLGYKSNGKNIISLCGILNVATVNRTLKVEIINSFSMDVETTYQNLPASMYIDIRSISTRKRYPAIIKTFKVNEIVFISKADFDKGEKVSFDIFHKNKLLSIDGMVVSRTKAKSIDEYNIKLDFDDYNLKKIYLSYLQELVSIMENSITDVHAKI